jgi:hypothetical protein
MRPSRTAVGHVAVAVKKGMRFAAKRTGTTGHLPRIVDGGTKAGVAAQRTSRLDLLINDRLAPATIIASDSTNDLAVLSTKAQITSIATFRRITDTLRRIPYSDRFPA